MPAITQAEAQARGAGPLKILTVTWSGDREHFELLRASLGHSALSSLPHQVIVQDEDLAEFERYEGPDLQLLSSREILPPSVEHERVRARRWQARCGRQLTTIMGSVARRVRWPRWVRYTGWHTQQLTKLAAVAASIEDTVVILDSDVVVTRHAQPGDFLAPDQFVCFHQPMELGAIRGKVRHWHETSCQLFDLPFPFNGQLDGYFDTPFVMHAPTVRTLMHWLEQRYALPWWQVLINLPPRRWSEFGCYKQFLREHLDPQRVQWRETGIMGYLYDASNPERLARAFDELVDQQRCHYITIHSQSSGRHNWDASDYSDLIRQRLIARQPAESASGD